MLLGVGIDEDHEGTFQVVSKILQSIPSFRSLSLAFACCPWLYNLVMVAADSCADDDKSFISRREKEEIVQNPTAIKDVIKKFRNIVHGFMGNGRT